MLLLSPLLIQKPKIQTIIGIGLEPGIVQFCHLSSFGRDCMLFRSSIIMKKVTKGKMSHSFALLTTYQHVCRESSKTQDDQRNICNRKNQKIKDSKKNKHPAIHKHEITKTDISI